MAEAIGVASGILAIVALTYKSTVSLCNGLKAVHNAPKSVRDLQNELLAISNVLWSLEQTVSDGEDEFESLRIPILRCGEACRDFEAIVHKIAGPDLQSSRWKLWAKIRYMGDDITAFQNMLAGYKSTISIAIGDANLRKMKVSANVLEEYKVIISTTKLDLEQHFETISDRLDILTQTSTNERGKLLDEMESTKHCIEICEEVAKHVDQLHPEVVRVPSSGGLAAEARGAMVVSATVAELMTAQSLTRCRDDLANTAQQLKQKLEEMSDGQLTLIGEAEDSPSDPARNNESRLLKAELQSVTERLAFLSQAASRTEQYRTNHFQDITMAEDGQQVLVSTVGDLINARGINIGARSLQLLGQMSDETLQQWSRAGGSSWKEQR